MKKEHKKVTTEEKMKRLLELQIQWKLEKEKEEKEEC